jgi:hypothetical protein
MEYLTPAQRERTAWRVLCPHHGAVFLTREEYNAQMMAPNARWACPAWENGDPNDRNDVGPGICGATCRWDDNWYEMWMDDLDRGS